jgi:regulator of RNase E activity RraB
MKTIDAQHQRLNFLLIKRFIKNNGQPLSILSHRMKIFEVESIEDALTEAFELGVETGKREEREEREDIQAHLTKVHYDLTTASLLPYDECYKILIKVVEALDQEFNKWNL